MSTAMSKPGPRPVKRNKVILKLRKAKRATSRELKVTTAYLSTLVDNGIVQVAAKADPKGKSGKGRKANVYSLTRKGSGKALSLQRVS